MKNLPAGDPVSDETLVRIYRFKGKRASSILLSGFVTQHTWLCPNEKSVIIQRLLSRIAFTKHIIDVLF